MLEAQVPSAVAVKGFTSLMLSLEVNACSGPIGDTKELTAHRESKRGLNVSFFVLGALLKQVCRRL